MSCRLRKDCSCKFREGVPGTKQESRQLKVVEKKKDKGIQEFEIVKSSSSSRFTPPGDYMKTEMQAKPAGA
ncbi:hypothetical protein ACLOJK_003829 [Asimina triloba]